MTLIINAYNIFKYLYENKIYLIFMLKYHYRFLAGIKKIRKYKYINDVIVLMIAAKNIEIINDSIFIDYFVLTFLS